MTRINKELLDFIKECREKGYSDLQIRQPLVKKGWPVNLINQAFESLNPKFRLKNQVCIFLNDETMDLLERRAKKNMFTMSEQIEDILRRSCLSGKKKKSYTPKLDDKLIEMFSRENRGRKKKKKK